MDMNSEREDYSLEIRQLLRDVLRAAVGGEFSAHREFPCLHVKTQYDGFTGEGGLPLYHMISRIPIKNMIGLVKLK